MKRLAVLLLLVASCFAADYPAPKEGDYTTKKFKFRDGQSLPELRLHYATIGTPHRDARGQVTNAVLILHGTGGSGKQFLQPQFANELFGPGQPLDATRYYIILPDNVGHGGSSKPSDGMHMRFPNYDYDDMVAAQHLLVTEGLGVGHLRLIFGTSMGCMHSFVWGETYPDSMDALMPMACQTVQIAGRNRMWRKAVIDSIKLDPAWNNGEYKEQPVNGVRSAVYILAIAGSAPLLWQRQYPSRDDANKFVEDTVEPRVRSLDANDMLYQFDSSRNYNPSPNLEKIRAPLMWINTTDDFINPPELTTAEREVKRIARGQFHLIQATDQTRGHGTHTWAVFWKQYLVQLLQESETATAALTPYEDADAYEVYAVVLPTVRAMRTLSNPFLRQETQPLHPVTDCTPANKFLELLGPALENYREVTLNTWLLQPKLKLDRPYQLQSQADLRQFYPRSHHIVVSAVGFNASRTIAVVYVADHCPGGLCSSGQVYAAEKKNGKWEPIEEVWGECGWIS